MRYFFITMRFFLAAILLMAFAQTNQAQDTRLLHQPDISEQKIVFVYAGDLWTADRQGGAATRLTSFPGVEMNPKFSPDGKWVAFSGQYQENLDVYIVASTGGTPKRLTWHPNADIVTGWSPDGKVIFMSNRDAGNGAAVKQYSIGLGDGVPQPRAERPAGAAVQEARRRRLGTRRGSGRDLEAAKPVLRARRRHPRGRRKFTPAPLGLWAVPRAVQ